MSNTQATKPSVLIVGGGPVGLMTAIVLSYNGIPVRIIEKNTTNRPGQRGAGVQPRSQELYSFIGILPELQKLSRPLMQMHLYQPSDGGAPRDAHFLTPVDPTPACPITRPLSLGQSRSEPILRNFLLSRFGVALELATELTHFEQDAEGVSCHIVKRSVDGYKVEEDVRVLYVVGADGARGVVRKALGLSYEGQALEQHMIIGDVRVQGLGPNPQSRWHIFGSFATQGLWLRPTEWDTPDLYQIIGSGPTVDAAGLTADYPKLAQWIREVTQLEGLTINVEWASEYRASSRMVNKFSEGRVFVAGDSAHIHPPAGAQGMNSGVQDAYNLAWKLALVLKGLSPPALLASYSDERLPVISEMIKRTTAMFNRVSKEGVDRGVNADSALYMLGINYRWSGVVVDYRGSGGEEAKGHAYLGKGDGVHAGDRAPDAPGLTIAHVAPHGSLPELKAGEATSLFKFFTPAKHTALVFLPEDAERSAVGAALRSFPPGTLQTLAVLPNGVGHGPSQGSAEVDVTLVDAQGHAFSGYGSQGVGITFVIVRPDGYVGAYVRDAAGIERYCAGVFGGSAQ
ncbi:hypothetical protein PUNSTDRAFT_146119 [Punctularia strigosozonata HHB-11173 SS5]|uniref:FAD-binding domain-containing protein n=1 Tax=Punctularia strigosozonata (strain HHB-11173) TaxID=741275 RepID=R7S4X4_PUNST|nr:uncharacterized protein PUNSTDRAFT_146119 [Punctularia strigosozonata HHB-11173 SS5]EIN05283.1 hypothetical protein PUNSTDRAFT_146119 [Punctularia strigosozonata HHB-11173 SS5]